MNDKTKNKIARSTTVGALINGGMGVLVAIFMPEPWYSYIGMIAGFAIGGAGCAFWLTSRRLRIRK